MEKNGHPLGLEALLVRVEVSRREVYARQAERITHHAPEGVLVVVLLDGEAVPSNDGREGWMDELRRRGRSLRSM